MEKIETVDLIIYLVKDRIKNIPEIREHLINDLFLNSIREDIKNKL